MNPNQNANSSIHLAANPELLAEVHDQARQNAHRLRSESIHELRGQVAQRFTHLLAGIFAR